MTTTDVSYLSPPRHFDDLPLSSWSAGASQVAAPKEAFANAKAYARSSRKGAPTPKPAAAGQPIPVELVRGANGPGDNSWTVLIDGVRCNSATTETEDGVPLFKLPSGVSLEPITSGTSVRPVSISVRLENEALSPLYSDVYTTQILRSYEREASQEEDDEKAIGSRVPIVPYRVSDIDAKAAVVPYPFWAPAQSAIGIMSLRPLNRYKERKSAKLAYNAWAAAMNTADEFAYNARKEAYDSLKATEVAEETLASVVGWASKLTGRQFRENATVAELRELRESIEKPTPPEVRQSKLIRQQPDGNRAQSYVLGGRKTSATKELISLFTVLVRQCEKILYDARNRSMSLSEHMGAMRLALQLSSNAKASVLFDALLDTDPYPPASLLLDLRSQDNDIFTFDEIKDITSTFRRRYFVREISKVEEERRGEGEFSDSRIFGTEFGPRKEGSEGDASGAVSGNRESAPDEASAGAGDAGATPPAKENEYLQFQVVRASDVSPGSDIDVAVRQSFSRQVQKEVEQTNSRIQKIKDGLGAVTGGIVKSSYRDYLFVYERLALEQRKQTTLRTRIHVQIGDFDGSEFRFMFEAEEENGIVAHAVYSEAKKEIDDFDVIAQRLVDVVFDVHAQERGEFARAKEEAFDAVRKASELLFSKYEPPKGPTETPIFSSVFDIAKYGLYDLPGSLARRVILGAPYNLDPSRLEHRVAELRLMVREAIPAWPPDRSDFREVLEVRPVESAAPESSSAQGATTSAGASNPWLQSDDGFKVDLERTLFGHGDEDKNEALKNGPADVGVTVSREDREEARKALQDAQRLGVGIEELKEARERERELEAEANKRMIEESEALQKLDQPPDSQSVVYRIAKEGDLDLLVRRLPHIVRVGESPRVAFQDYVFDELRAQLPASDAEKWRWGASVALAVGATAAWLGIATLGVVAFDLAFQAILGTFKDDVDKQYFSKMAKKAVNFAASLASTAVRDAGDLATESNVSFGIRLAASYFEEAQFEALGIKSKDFISFWRKNSVGLPFGANMATLTLQYANHKLNLSKQYDAEAYLKHRARLMKSPAGSAVAAARDAIRKISGSGPNEISAWSEHRNSLGVLLGSSRGMRFCFYEYYELTQEASAVVAAMPRVKIGGDWAMYSGISMRTTLPPLDVAERINRVEKLRAIPFALSAEFTSGGGYVSSTSTSIAAAEAIRQIKSDVEMSRRRYRGANVMQTPEATCVDVVKSAALAIRAAFSTKSGVTLVGGDDIMWTCSRGGAAARLSLNCLPLFSEAEEVLSMASTGISRVDALRRFWAPPRLEMMEDFSRSLLEQAGAIAKEGNHARITSELFEDGCVEAARFFSRVKALASPSATPESRKATVLLVASTAISSVDQFGALQNAMGREWFFRVISDAQKAADAFEDQRNVTEPPTPLDSEKRRAFSWASMRINPSMARDFEIGAGAESLVDMLSGLDVSPEERAGNAGEEYYCPVGIRPGELSRHSRLSFDARSSRVIWLRRLSEKADALSRSARLSDSVDAGDRLSIKLHVLDGADSSNLTGLSRHPFVVRRDSEGIHIHLSAVDSRLRKEALGAAPRTLAEALRQRASLSPEILSERSKLVRAVKFNSERFLLALSLWKSSMSSFKGVAVRIDDKGHILSLLLALCMLSDDLGDHAEDVAVYTESPSNIEEFSRGVAESARSAMRMGCRACSVVEAALALG